MSVLNNYKNKKWIVAVSGGSDSMALLNMCVENNMDIVVAHVNYQKRETANRDMIGVQKYCEDHNILCRIKIVDSYKETGNFQAKARNIRYQFFKQLVNEFKAEGVLVAHQKEDVLETYFLNEEANRIPSYYGIKKEIIIDTLKIVRPLLSYTKKQLQNYCIENNVLYYEDESNASTKYKRNKIRHTLINTMSESEKEELIIVLDNKNKEKQTKEIEIDLYLKDKQYLEINKLNKYSYEEKFMILRQYIVNESKNTNISKKTISQMIESISDNNTNKRHTINNEYDLVIEYGKVFVERKEEVLSYSYKLDKIEYFDTEYFKTSNEGKKIESIYLTESDFPITIRNARKEDTITMRFGTKKVNRFFIDRKIPHKERKIWPVVENKEGNIIFVSGMGCDIKHYSNNSCFFVIK